jgi:hypothetical protein
MTREMGRDTSAKLEAPRVIRMHPDDNVAIVVNDLGAPAGAQLLSGPTLREYVPQGHKVALFDIAHGAPVRRYNVVIGYAAQALPAGSWVNEQRLVMPTPPALEGLPIATNNAPLAPALEGYTFEGYRNPDGSVGTRNILAITTTVQCVSGVVEHAVGRIRAELLPRYPNVDDVVGSTFTAAAWPSTRPKLRSPSGRSATSASIQILAAARWSSASAARSCSPTVCCRPGRCGHAPLPVRGITISSHCRIHRTSASTP